MVITFVNDELSMSYLPADGALAGALPEPAGLVVAAGFSSFSAET